jgi:hypothetical protein
VLLRRFAFLAMAVLTGLMLLVAAEPAGATASASTPTITIALSPATLDYGHQSIVVSGTVSTVPSGTDVTVAYENSSGQSDQAVTATGASGAYQVTLTSLEPAAQDITATVAATSTTTSASVSAALAFVQDDVTITASFAHAWVNPETTDTLSGVATAMSNGSPVPLARATLSISSPGDFPYSPPVSATVTTASDGSFSYVAPGEYGDPQTFTISSAATSYLAAAQATASYGDNWAAQITNFTGTLSAEHVLQFDACGGISSVLADGPLIGNLYYQYSTRQGGPWKTLGTGKVDLAGDCFGNLDGANYPGTFHAPLAGYYRAYTPQIDGQTAASSPAIYLSRYRTKITRFSVAPATVRRDGVVTISGRLWWLGRKWMADAGQRITIEYSYQNTTHVLRVRLTTNSTGWFRGTYRAPHTAVWVATYLGGSDGYAAATAPVKVTVR